MVLATRRSANDSSSSFHPSNPRNRRYWLDSDLLGQLGPARSLPGCEFGSFWVEVSAALTVALRIQIVAEARAEAWLMPGARRPVLVMGWVWRILALALVELMLGGLGLARLLGLASAGRVMPLAGG